MLQFLSAYVQAHTPIFLDAAPRDFSCEVRQLVRHTSLGRLPPTGKSTDLEGFTNFTVGDSCETR